jgi:hypothetical protein
MYKTPSERLVPMPANYSPALNANVNPWFSGKTSSFNELRERTAPFDPAGLYASAVPGAWFEPSRTTCFKASQGGTYIPANYGDPVALILDQSRAGVSSPNLADTAVARTFQGDIATVSGDSFIVKRGNTINSFVSIPVTGLCEVVLEVEEVPGYPASVDIRDGVTPSKSAGVGTHRILIKLNSSFSVLAHYGYSAKVTFVSVRKITGNHALQTAVSKQPILCRGPSPETRNLLTYTDELTAAAWSKIYCLPVATGVKGEYRITGMDASADRLDFNTVIPAAPGDTYTYSVDLKGSGSAGITVNLTSGGGKEIGVPLTSDWVRHTVTHTFTEGQAGNLRIHAVIVRNASNPEVYIRRPQLERGGVATPYQRVSGASDVYEAGEATHTYLKFDGVDDFMVTQPIAFNSTDEMAVFAGVKKTGGSGNVIVAELGTSGYDAYNDRPIDPVSSDDHFFFTSNDAGDVFSNTWTDAANSPQGSVLSASSDISDQISTMRVDGVDVATDTGTQGVGNYETYPLYIGARAGTSMFFKGDVFSLLVVGQQTDTDTTVKMEKRTDARTA